MGMLLPCQGRGGRREGLLVDRRLVEVLLLDQRRGDRGAGRRLRRAPRRDVERRPGKGRLRQAGHGDHALGERAQGGAHPAGRGRGRLQLHSPEPGHPAGRLHHHRERRQRERDQDAGGAEEGAPKGRPARGPGQIADLQGGGHQGRPPGRHLRRLQAGPGGPGDQGGASPGVEQAPPLVPHRGRRPDPGGQRYQGRLHGDLGGDEAGRRAKHLRPSLGRCRLLLDGGSPPRTLLPCVALPVGGRVEGRTARPPAPAPLPA
mmetsp:Transcript_130821/g.406805  ORF Transcript_130821/g.406805 Transcript_130821/m.406805 type:complete len:261 (+) Transcript_130821:120-902(+)